jgi:hypothetical protein
MVLYVLSDHFFIETNSANTITSTPKMAIPITFAQLLVSMKQIDAELTFQETYDAWHCIFPGIDRTI